MWNVQREKYLARKCAFIQQLKWKDLGSADKDLFEQKQRLPMLATNHWFHYCHTWEVAFSSNLKSQRLATRLVWSYAFNGSFKDSKVGLHKQASDSYVQNNKTVSDEHSHNTFFPFSFPNFTSALEQYTISIIRSNNHIITLTAQTNRSPNALLSIVGWLQSTPFSVCLMHIFAGLGK